MTRDELENLDTYDAVEISAGQMRVILDLADKLGTCISARGQTRSKNMETTLHEALALVKAEIKAGHVASYYVEDGSSWRNRPRAASASGSRCRMRTRLTICEGRSMDIVEELRTHHWPSAAGTTFLTEQQSRAADEIERLRTQLSLVASNLEKGMSKSVQRLQAKAIMDVLQEQA